MARQDGIRAREAILAAIAEHFETAGYSPSTRDLAAATGLASSTVQFHLDELVRIGRVQRDPKVPRSLRLVSQ